MTPDTLLRWYRHLIARKYDGSAKRGRGRPRTASEIVALVVRMAVENPRLVQTDGPVRRRARAGNLRNYYYKQAA